MREYTYYVAFLHSTGHGSMEVAIDHELSSYNDIHGIAKMIERQGSVEHVTIINYKLLQWKGVDFGSEPSRSE